LSETGGRLTVDTAVVGAQPGTDALSGGESFHDFRHERRRWTLVCIVTMSAVSNPAFFNKGVVTACFCELGNLPCDNDATQEQINKLVERKGRDRVESTRLHWCMGDVITTR